MDGVVRIVQQKSSWTIVDFEAHTFDNVAQSLRKKARYTLRRMTLQSPPSDVQTHCGETQISFVFAVCSMSVGRSCMAMGRSNGGTI